MYICVCYIYTYVYVDEKGWLRKYKNRKRKLLLCGNNRGHQKKILLISRKTYSLLANLLDSRWVQFHFLEDMVSNWRFQIFKRVPILYQDLGWSWNWWDQRSFLVGLGELVGCWGLKAIGSLYANTYFTLCLEIVQQVCMNLCLCILKRKL